ncbi:hypothetical protein F5B20DRAFT_576007 [Whalleya microplaca]|nr:hypothetical protein F5B20DRAFT_576007 [Whalleya microplaca]
MLTSQEGKPSFVAGELDHSDEDVYSRDAIRGQLQVLKEYAAGNMNVDECASRITFHTANTASNDGATPEDVYDAVSTLIRTLHHSAIMNPTFQPIIMDLLEVIQRLPAQGVPSEGEGIDWVAIGDENNKLWADWPLFLANLTDTYMWEEHLFLESQGADSQKDTKAATERWASANAWVARLVSSGNKKIGDTIFLHNASYRILRVLDVEGHPHFTGEVPAAANLFRYAALILLSLSREQPPPPDPPIGVYSSKAKEYSEDRKVLWSEPGYSVSRWRWWKTRWSQLAEVGDPDIVPHAREALVAMEEAEVKLGYEV